MFPKLLRLLPNFFSYGQLSKKVGRLVSTRLRGYYRHLEETIVNTNSYFKSLMERARREQEDRPRSSLGATD